MKTEKWIKDRLKFALKERRAFIVGSDMYYRLDDEVRLLREILKDK